MYSAEMLIISHSSTLTECLLCVMSFGSCEKQRRERSLTPVPLGQGQDSSGFCEANMLIEYSRHRLKVYTEVGNCLFLNH